MRKMMLAAATMLALPFAASAQPVNGLYVAAGAGANFKQDQGFSGFLCGNGCGNSTQLSYDTGYAVLGSVGWGFGNGLRLEVEGNFRNNGLNNVSGGGLNAHASGDNNTYGVMANALFDMNVGLNWMFPYIGGGVGYGWSQYNNARASVSNGPLASGQADGTVGGFAYQGIAGAAFPIAAVPGLSITAEYRFLGVLGGNLNGISCGIDCVRTRFKTEDQANHSLMLGVRYAFNAAPAAVMAAPVPMAATPATKSFLVFFDWDKSVLTDRARGIIQDAAKASKATAHTQIEVNGYADTSGSPHYNMGLSMRRAQTVAAELVRNGVAKQEIAIKAFGDTVLLVPTGPGVREPQNRRVEIIIR
jgi:OmpA-OmpF porin, OOP family